MRYAILLTILSVCCGFSGCEKPDAFICTMIIKKPLEASYAFCRNSKTKVEKNVPVQDLNDYIVTDLESYETFRSWYKEQCGK